MGHCGTIWPTNLLVGMNLMTNNVQFSRLYLVLRQWLKENRLLGLHAYVFPLIFLPLGIVYLVSLNLLAFLRIADLIFSAGILKYCPFSVDTIFSDHQHWSWYPVISV